MSETFESFLYICTCISVIGGAFVFIIDVFKPIKKREDDFARLEVKAKEFDQYVAQTDLYFQKLGVCIITLIDHEITGNSTENLKRVKEEFQRFLLSQK